MKRRDFFKRIVGGAAALLGIKALKPKKEWVYGEFWVNKDRFVVDQPEHVFYDHGTMNGYVQMHDVTFLKTADRVWSVHSKPYGKGLMHFVTDMPNLV